MGGCAMIVELQGDADDVVTLVFQKAGDDGRINTARHRNDDSGLFGAPRKVQAIHDRNFRCSTAGFMPMRGI
ncbi:hypothetical protein GCM10007937_29000 [Mesorhizobium albiziae]|nr:hypothetical protein GCM10007937_29000 [Mesorhizobium albiziae]